MVSISDRTHLGGPGAQALPGLHATSRGLREQQLQAWPVVCGAHGLP